MTNSKRMKKMTENILNLTLEIIFLLTGEDYTLVKKTFGDYVAPNSHPDKSKGWSNSQRLTIEPPTASSERTNKKILEVTQKIIDLLTGEVPIRCQDVTVYFSMEEWEYIEGHKDLYKDVMMDNQPPLTSPEGSSNRNPSERCSRPLYSQDSTQEPQEDQLDGSSNRNPPERCPRLLYSQDSKQEDPEIPQEDQVDGSSNRNPPERCPRPLYSQDSKQEHLEIPLDQGEFLMTIKEESEEETEDLYVIGDGPYKEEDISLEISTGTQHNWNDSEIHSIIRLDGEVEDQIIISDSSEEDSGTLYLSCADLSSDYFALGGDFPDSTPPVTSYMACRGTETFPYFKHEEDAQRAELILLQRSYMGEKTFSRLECGEGFPRMSSLIEHQNLHTGAKPYSCMECGRSFSRKSNLIAHTKSHAGEQPFSCLECGERFTRKSSLMAHESLHAGEKIYSCAECGKCFSRKANLITHEKSHTGEKPFSCMECGERFTRKSSLLTHVSLHAGTKPYSCPDCGKCFSRKANLIMHKKVHTGEKPFFCLQCGERFTRKSSLNRHQIVHTGIKPFSCSECGESFNRSSSLIRHGKVHMVKSYLCLECGRCFKLRSHLVYHQQSYASKSYSCSEVDQGVTGTVMSF